MTFSSSGIQHSAGKSVLYDRDEKGRIRSIVGPKGQTLHFEYDLRGDLIAVTDPDGNVTRYRYNSSHGIVEIIDPLGRCAVRNEYDDDGRLIANIDANGRRIEYTHQVGDRQEIIRDRRGNVTVINYDADGTSFKPSMPWETPPPTLTTQMETS
jgi:YD repeat-containing protein